MIRKTLKANFTCPYLIWLNTEGLPGTMRAKVYMFWVNLTRIRKV